MLKFSVSLNQSFNYEVENDFNEKGIIINYIDDLLDDLVIVSAKSKRLVESSLFAKNVQDIRKGRLLDIPNITPTLTMYPTPMISKEPLEKLGLYGLGQKVAVIDSGYFPTINSNVEIAENFTEDITSEAKVSHGPMVMSLLRNYAYASKIFSAKVAIEDTGIDEEHVFRALKWVRSIEGLKIINISLGFERECRGNCNLSRVVNKMSNLGYLIISAVGNSGGLAQCPACADGSISVGALDKTGDKVASFSSKGHINSTKPDLVAPGCGVSIYGTDQSPYYGTSFAAPIVTGILTALNNSINHFKAKEYLYESCERLLDEPISKQGSGRLNLLKLMEVIENEKTFS